MTKEELNGIQCLLKNAKKNVKFTDSSESILKATAFNLAIDEALRLTEAFANGNVEAAVLTTLKEKYSNGQ